MKDGDEQEANEAGSTNRHAPSVHAPEFRQGVKLQDFSRAILGISDIARELSALYDGLTNKSPDSILTGHVRQMSVSLRSVLLNDGGRLLGGMFKDEWAPAWQRQRAGVAAKVVVDASPYEELDYAVGGTGERRTLKVPGYKHGFIVTSLPGLGNSGEGRYTILENRDIWDFDEPVALKAWVRHELFEVDGLVYDVDKCIKCVADKEGAHIDKVVDSDGIYTGNRANRKVQFTNDDAYILSRMVKFGPFSYPHVVVIVVSRYLVDMLKETLKTRQVEVQSILRQFTLTQERVASTRERIGLIMKCPIFGRIDGLPLRAIPERLVMRPPIDVGLTSLADEQARADELPRYGESYVGIPRRP